jgi:sigma-E factor negative regulatory protein RseB
MILLSLRILGTTLALLLSPARADEGARDWLARVGHAAATLNYDGSFVYQHGEEIESLRIVHVIHEGRVRERIETLTGTPREFVRRDNEVQCILPEEKTVVVEPRHAGNSGFPSVLSERLQDIEGNYTLTEGADGRVGGRAARQIFIRPRDNYRYGYELWIDRDSGLLLRSDLLDTGGRLLERFMFVQIRIGGPIAATALRPDHASDGYAWHRAPNAAVNAGASSWVAGRLPAGFRLSTEMLRSVGTGDRPVEQLVFTDGLATVSVFVESRKNVNDTSLSGANRMGAVHAYGTRIDDFQVTAVGEVPADTVALIGGSLARKAQ